MSQVPQDLDLTMWQIAERGDGQAAAEFAQKFPELGGSMESRMKMVAGMKSMRTALAPAAIPAFSPKFMHKPKPLWARYGPMALGLTALAVGSFLITQNMLTPLPTPEDLRPHPVPSQQPGQAPLWLPPPTPASSDVDAPRPARKPFDEDVLDKHFVLKNVTLKSAMTAMADEANLKLEIPPDFPNPKIKVEFTEKPGIDALQRLGEKEGFTVMPDGPGQVIIIPGKPDNSAAASGDGNAPVPSGQDDITTTPH